MPIVLPSPVFTFGIAPQSGADSTSYWLVPSVSIIKMRSNGIFSPDTVSCLSYYKTGDGNPTVGAGTIKYIVTYADGSKSSEVAYSSAITIQSNFQSIEFIQYVAGVVVDRKSSVVVSDGPTGDPGPMGKRGALPYPQGEWDAKTVYTATENVAPYVWYEPGKQYYVLNKVGSVSGTPPPDDYISDKNWIPFDYLKAVYAEILMTRFAKLASAVFYGDYMISQFGVNEYGNDDENYERFDPSLIGKPDCPYTPNIMLDMLKGKALFNDMEASGKVNATSGIFNNVDIESGKVGGFDITELGLTNEGLNNDAYIIIRNDSKKTFAAIGDVLPAESGIRALGRFTNQRSGSQKNTGIVVGAENSTSANNAIDIISGKITNINLNVEERQEGNIGSNVNFVTVVGNPSYDPTFYLPNPAETGKMIFIVSGARAINVNGNGRDIYRSGDFIRQVKIGGVSRISMFVCVRENWMQSYLQAT